MFKRILLPSDGSEVAYRAAEKVANLIASERDARVTILIVTLPLDTENTDFDKEMVVAHNARMRQQAETVLEKTKRIFTVRDIASDGKIREGATISALIAQEAESGRYDLIAMSSRGLSMQRDKLNYMGSVTEHVIRRVSIPVLVFPVQQEE